MGFLSNSIHFSRKHRAAQRIRRKVRMKFVRHPTKHIIQRMRYGKKTADSTAAVPEGGGVET